MATGEAGSLLLHGLLFFDLFSFLDQLWPEFSEMMEIFFICAIHCGNHYSHVATQHQKCVSVTEELKCSFY